jgi:hypothetical protein
MKKKIFVTWDGLKMTTWRQNSEDVRVIDLPFCKQMVAKYLILSLTPSGDLQNAFLYTDSYYAGIVSAKLSTQDEYMAIGAYSITPSCFLGDLTASIEVTVDLEILFTESYDSEQIIPISLGYGENILPRASNFWHKDTTETPFFWYETEEEFDLSWIEGAS